MSAAAARRKLLPLVLVATATALLLGVTVAQASLPGNAARSELLAKSALATALANADRLEQRRFLAQEKSNDGPEDLASSLGGKQRRVFTLDLAGELADKLQNSDRVEKRRFYGPSFSLLKRPSSPASRLTACLADDACAQALASALERLRAEKLTSGVLAWEPRLNIWRMRQLASISWWGLGRGAFPGGQNNGFQGMWTDPVTGLAYARARWLDSRNATWLSEDPAGDVDSPNLYSFVAWQPNMARDPMGLWRCPRGERCVGDPATYEGVEYPSDAVIPCPPGEACWAPPKEPVWLSPIEGNANRGRIWYQLNQLFPGLDQADTSINPFAPASQRGADLSQYKRTHSKEALAIDTAVSLSPQGRAMKVFGLFAALSSYAEREEEALKWAGKWKGLNNEEALTVEGRHVVTRLQEMTNQAEDLLDSGKATSDTALRYYGDVKAKNWWRFFSRGQALQTEMEKLRREAARTDPLLAQVQVTPRLYGRYPDFVYMQADGRRVILDVTSPRDSVALKALIKYGSEARDIIIELYHRGRGIPK
jgi:RHS repeat-associated protein